MAGLRLIQATNPALERAMVLIGDRQIPAYVCHQRLFYLSYRQMLNYQLELSAILPIEWRSYAT